MDAPPAGVVHYLHPQVLRRLLRLLIMHSATSFQAAVLDRHVLTTFPQVPALSSGVVGDHRLMAPAQLPMSGHDRCAHTHHYGPRPKITAEAKVPQDI